MLVTTHFPYKSRGVLICQRTAVQLSVRWDKSTWLKSPFFFLFSFPASGWSTVLLQGEEVTADPIGTNADMAIQVRLSLWLLHGLRYFQVGQWQAPSALLASLYNGHRVS